MENSSIQIAQVAGLWVGYRWPEGIEPPGLLLLLHGWTGDERSMWIFTERLSLPRLILAPRGIFSAPGGGYSWTGERLRGWPAVDDFQPAIDALMMMLSQPKWKGAAEKPWVVIGFSQGAALAYTLALRYPSRIRALVGLSGFLPGGVEELVASRPLDGLRIYIAHGTQDTLVEAGQAREARRMLTLAGGVVEYCEEDVGHKLSRACFRGMEAFLAALPG